MRKLAFAFACIALFTLCPASRAVAADRKIKIGVSMAVFDDVWLTFVRDSITKWAAAHPDIALTMVDAKNDTAKQMGQVENFLAQKMDAIVALPVDTAAADPMIKAVLAAKVPLVLVNRYPDNLPKSVTYVGSDSIDAGVFQGEEIAKALGGKGNVVLMMGELSNEAAIKRTEGVKKVLAKYPGIKILREQTGNWKREEGRTLMENWLASGERIDAVASNNDEMALGALMAIKASGKLGKIYVGGTDGSPDALDSMAKGELNMTVYQDPVGQGEGGIEAAYLAATGKPNPKVKGGIVWIPYQKITRDNYTKFMKR